MRYISGRTTLQCIFIWGFVIRWQGEFLILAANDDDRPESWYKKYDAYPPYCSTPREMQTRAVPPLPDVSRNIYGETRIQHVSAIIRHGARTPWASNENCFPKVPTDLADTVWNCKLTTIMTPPSAVTVDEEEGLSDKSQRDQDASFFLFEKFYDALPYLKDGLSNELNGTCQKGQLLLRGYEQELKNGQILRDAYTYTYDSMDHDERMRLIELSFHEFSAWDPNHLRFRSDADQRTIMSGQVVLRGLLDQEAEAYFRETGQYPTIPLHIGDRNRDVMAPNPKVCPKLADIATRARQSDEYQNFNNSREMMEAQYFLDNTVGKMDDKMILDCLMTTMCTDRDLPEAINDYGKPDSWFEKVAALDVKDYTMVMKYNDAEHAKLGMGPLWSEIKDLWALFLTRDNNGKNPVAADGTVPPRLALYSGHDTTIMPLLASIHPSLWNDTEWAPYASMLLFEIHEFIDSWNRTLFDSRYAFRMIYNGKVLTKQVPGCYADLELCDFQTLLKIIEPFATRSPDCASQPPQQGGFLNAVAVVNTKKGILMFFALIVVGVVIGAISAYILLTGNLCGRRILSYTPIDDTVARIVLQEEEEEGSFGNGKDGLQRFQD